MRKALIVLLGLGSTLACSGGQNNNGGGGAAGAATGGTGATASGGAPGSGGNNTGGAAGGGLVDTSCLGILSCLGKCADNDTACVDACFAVGDQTAQNQLVALLQCIDQKACADVSCIETSCQTELVACIEGSTVGSGTPNPSGTVPPGSIPSELVGHWSRPGSSEVRDFTFGADGSAKHSKYKEWTLSGQCPAQIHTVYDTGSVVASGDQLTMTFAEGKTTVVYTGGGCTSYQSSPEAFVGHYKYQLDTSGAEPTLWLTDLNCSGEYCAQPYLKK